MTVFAWSDLFRGVRLTPTQRRIAHCLVQHAGSGGLPVRGRGRRAGPGQPAVGDPVRDRARLRRLPGAAPPAARAGRRRRPRGRADATPTTSSSGPCAPRSTTCAGSPTGSPTASRVAAAGRAARRQPPAAGARACAPPRRWPAYFGYFAAKVHPDVRVLDAGGSLLADRLEQARAAGATAHAGDRAAPLPARGGRRAARGPRAPGWPSWLITDSPVSPAADHADVVLPAAVGAQLVFDLHAAPMALAMVLLQAICDADAGRRPSAGSRSSNGPPPAASSSSARRGHQTMYESSRAARGTDAHRPRLAAGGRPADADEQPRPRGRRAPRGPRRLRRHRQGGPRLAVVPRAGPHADRRCGDDETMLVQSGRPVGRVPHPRVGAAGADRQLQPGRRLGHLAGVPPAGGARPDHVRPDDRRLVDLHRHPGHPAGHLRDVRRGRREAVRRHARRHAHAHRRLRRDGRRAAARGHHERRRLPDHRRRPGPAATAGSTTATSTWSPTSLDEARRDRRSRRSADRRALSVGVVGNAADGLSPSCCAAASRSTSSPTRPARTTRCPTCPRASTRPTRPTTPRAKPEEFTDRARASMAGTSRRWSASWTPAPRSSTTATRSAARRSSAATSGRSPSPASCPRTSGRCSARARARSAGRRCPATRPTSPRPTGRCSTCSRRTSRWPAGSGWPASGSRSRACRPGSAGSGYGERDKAGRAVQRDGRRRRAVGARS